MVKRKLELESSEIMEAADNAMVHGIISAMSPVKSGETHCILSILLGNRLMKKTINFCTAATVTVSRYLSLQFHIYLYMLILANIHSISSMRTYV